MSFLLSTYRAVACAQIKPRENEVWRGDAGGEEGARGKPGSRGDQGSTFNHGTEQDYIAYFHVHANGPK